MRVMTPVRRLSRWSKGSEAILVQGGQRGREVELADRLGEEIAIDRILSFGLSNWVDGGPLTDMETDRQRNRFRLGVKGGRQAAFIPARQVGESWSSQTVMSG